MGGSPKSTEIIRNNYKEIIECLEEIIDNDSYDLSGDEIATATGILTCIKKKQFVYMLLFLYNLLEILKPADKFFQSREVGYIDAAPMIKATLKEVEKLRNDEQYDELTAQVVMFISKNQIELLQNRQRSCNLTDRPTEEEKIRSDYFETLDAVASEIKNRFVENDDILSALLYAADVNKLDIDLLRPLANLNRIEMPSDYEFNIVKQFLIEQDVNDSDKYKGKSIMERLYNARAGFEKTFKLFCAIDTFGCSIALCECSFSCLSRVGIMGRVHMKNERLRNLTLLAFEHAELKEIPKDDILRHFNENKKRRLQIF